MEVEKRWYDKYELLEAEQNLANKILSYRISDFTNDGTVIQYVNIVRSIRFGNNSEYVELEFSDGSIQKIMLYSDDIPHIKFSTKINLPGVNSHRLLEKIMNDIIFTYYMWKIDGKWELIHNYYSYNRYD